MENHIGFLIDFEKDIIDYYLLEDKQNIERDKECVCFKLTFQEGIDLINKGYFDDAFLMFYITLLHLNYYNIILDNKNCKKEWDYYFQENASGKKEHFESTYGVSQPFIDVVTKRNAVVHKGVNVSQVLSEKDMLLCLYLINIVLKSILQKKSEFDFMNVLLVSASLFAFGQKEKNEKQKEEYFDKANEEIYFLIEKIRNNPELFINEVDFSHIDEEFYMHFSQYLRQEIIEKLFAETYDLPEKLYDFYTSIFSLDKGRDFFKLVNLYCRILACDENSHNNKHIDKFISTIWSEIPKEKIDIEIEKVIDHKLLQLEQRCEKTP